MADEHYKWLNRETAERLLRGESLEAVDAAARDQAERLAEALGALSAQAAPAAGELPGEQGALAAFRKAREAAEAERTAAAFGAGTPARRTGASARGTDAGLVRIGAQGRTGIRSRRPRWARPVRLTLAAALAAGTLGGVAMAAGGVLPLPFHDEHPAPATSVSAGQTSAPPQASPSPRAPQGLTPGTGAPDAGTGGSRGGEPSGHAPGTDQGATPGSDASAGTPGAWWQEATAACRDLRDGKELGGDRRRALEGLAGGSTRVTKYCKSVLAGQYTAGGQDGNGKGGDKGSGGQDKNGGGKDKGEGKGQGDDEGHRGHGRDRGHGSGSGGHGSDGHRRGGMASPVPTLFTPTPGKAAGAPTPSPSPSYTAL